MADTMPIGKIVTPTSKWQITIPKKVRETVGLEEKTPLNVSSEKGKIVMTPIRKIVKEDVWTEERRKQLLKALKEIKGIWADDKDFEKRQKERRKIEIRAAKKMRKAW